MRKSLAMAIALVMVAAPLHAQPSPTATDRFWAKQRANEARRLLAARRISEACAKYAESYGHVPNVGTLLDLGACHEKEGKTATAYADFLKARELAREDRNAYWAKVRGTAASKRIQALEPKLSRLTVVVEDAQPDLTVQVGGSSLPPEQLGKAVPVDPGEHEVTANAPGHKPWRTTVEIGPRADTQTVKVPRLEAESGAAAAASQPAPVATSQPRRTAAPAPATPADDGPERHRPAAAMYGRTGFGVYLSDARTIGGIGGGLGVRIPVGRWPFVQVDASYLFMIGNAVELRAGAGLQRPGLYTPAATLLVSAFAGSGLRFLTDDHPVPIEAPAAAVGLHLAPLRFTKGGTHASLLEAGFGVGTDLPGLGFTYEATLLEVGTSF